MSDWQDAKKQIKSQGPQTFKWIHVYDSGQWHAAGDYIPSIVTAYAIGNGEGIMQASITVSSVADMVRKVNEFTDTKQVGLRIFGPGKTGGFEADRACYVSIGRNNGNDSSGEYSLQIDGKGKLVGPAAIHLGKLSRVTKIRMMDASVMWNLQLFWSIGLALPHRFAEITAQGQGTYVRMDRVEREPVYAKMLAKEKAAREKPIQEAKLETGNLKNHLDELSGKPKPVMAQRVNGKTYVVANGDSLSSIASRFYGSPAKWRDLYDANRMAIGPNPNALRSGTELTI